MTDTETTITANSGIIANDPLTNDIQDKAVRAFKDADKAEGLKRSSRTMLVYCLIAAGAAPLSAVLKNQKGETVFSHAFTLADYCDPDHVAAAVGDNNQAKGAMTKAVIERLSGFADSTAAQRQALSQAAPVAFHLRAMIESEGGDVATDVALSKRGNVQVPGYVMLKAPDPEKAPESELARYEREKALPFVLDGSPKHSFAELSSRTRPATTREGNSGQGGDAGKAMSRTDAATVLLRGAVGGDDWIAYLASLSSAELCVALSLYSERNGDAAEAA